MVAMSAASVGSPAEDLPIAGLRLAEKASRTWQSAGLNHS
jgi:hypothetical protein